MRFAGLALCLLASSMGARAESLEDRVATLEARVKALEQALRTQGGLTNNTKPVTASSVEGTYQAFSPNGDRIVFELAQGHIIATFGSLAKAGTYEVVSDHLIATIEGKTEVLNIEGTHLRAEKIDLSRIK